MSPKRFYARIRVEEDFGVGYVMDFHYLEKSISHDEAALDQAWLMFINNFLEAVPEVRHEIRQ